MKRLIIVLTLAVLVGCQQPAPEMAQAPSPSPSADIDFAKWPTATERPIPVNPEVIAFCAPHRSPDPKQEAIRKSHGPHYQPAIVVRVNPEAIAEFKAGRVPMPVGTTIVKEKHYDSFAKGPPPEYGAMIKREPGYDPAHGDWEYLFVANHPEKKVTRGKIEACIECHSHAKEKDHLFRTYLPGNAAPVSGW